MKTRLKNYIGVARNLYATRSESGVLQHARTHLGLNTKAVGSIGKKLEIPMGEDAPMSYMICRRVDATAVDVDFYSDEQVYAALSVLTPVSTTSITFETPSEFDHVAGNNFIVYEEAGLRKAAAYFVRCCKNRQDVGFVSLESNSVMPSRYPCYVSMTLARPGRVEITSCISIAEMHGVLNMVRGNDA